MARRPYRTRSRRARSGRSPDWVGRWIADQAAVGHVADQHPGHAQGQVEAGRDLGDGEDVAAQGGDGPLLHGQLGRPLPSEVVETSASISRSVWAGLVRPPVMA